MNEWRAHLIETDRLRRVLRLVVYRELGEGKIQYVGTSDATSGVVYTLDESIEPGPEIGFSIPHQALAAVAEVFYPYAGHKVEVARLEESLRVERERVDSILRRFAASSA